MTCCGKVKLENFNFANGFYILDPATREYKQEDGNNILHQRKGEIGWFVSEFTDPGTAYLLYYNSVGFCIYYI